MNHLIRHDWKMKINSEFFLPKHMNNNSSDEHYRVIDYPVCDFPRSNITRSVMWGLFKRAKGIIERNINLFPYMMWQRLIRQGPQSIYSDYLWKIKFITVAEYTGNYVLNSEEAITNTQTMSSRREQDFRNEYMDTGCRSMWIQLEINETLGITAKMMFTAPKV